MTGTVHSLLLWIFLVAYSKLYITERERVTAAWRRWREIANLLVNHSIGLRTRGKVFEACVKFALLYAAETWTWTSRLMDALYRCDHRMLRYMAGVRWQDRRCSSEVEMMCGVDNLSVKLRQRRLRWVGHVKRVEGGCWVRWGRWELIRGTTASRMAYGKLKWMCDGGYKLVGSGGAFGTGLTDLDVESSHCWSNPILVGKIWTLIENDNDDDDLKHWIE